MEEFPQHRPDWQRKSILTKGSHNMCLAEEENRERGISRPLQEVVAYIPKTQRLSHFSMWEEPPNIPAHFHVKTDEIVC
jgi:hypothetical protein